MKNRAFTLLEIIVVVIIIGILASLGMVNYTGIKEKAICKEAITNLKLVAAAERQYKMDHGQYYPCCGVTETNLNNINTNLKLDLTDKNWTWAIAGGRVGATGGPWFTAIADRNGSGGGWPNNYLDCAYTMRETMNDPAPNPPCAQR